MPKLTHKTQALKMLEALGWTVADVEKWLPRTNIRVDLFGFADLLCVKGGQTLAVQVCSVRIKGGDVSTHQTKMLAEPRLVECLRAGWLVELWGVYSDTPSKNGEKVRARLFEISEDGERVVALEGSEVLNL